MRTIDFSPLYRSAVGFDRMASQLEAATRATRETGRPPYDIVQTGDDAYRIDIATAGFAAEDLEIEMREGELIVTGRPDITSPDGETGTYLHRGLMHRNFDLRFQLADHVFARSADLRHGVLSITLVRELPEALKPRRIDIAPGGSRRAESVAKAA